MASDLAERKENLSEKIASARQKQGGLLASGRAGQRQRDAGGGIGGGVKGDGGAMEAITIIYKDTGESQTFVGTPEEVDSVLHSARLNRIASPQQRFQAELLGKVGFDVKKVGTTLEATRNGRTTVITAGGGTASAANVGAINRSFIPTIGEQRVVSRVRAASKREGMLSGQRLRFLGGKERAGETASRINLEGNLSPAAASLFKLRKTELNLKAGKEARLTHYPTLSTSGEIYGRQEYGTGIKGKKDVFFSKAAFRLEKAKVFSGNFLQSAKERVFAIDVKYGMGDIARNFRGEVGINQGGKKTLGVIEKKTFKDVYVKIIPSSVKGYLAKKKVEISAIPSLGLEKAKVFSGNFWNEIRRGTSLAAVNVASSFADRPVQSSVEFAFIGKTLGLLPQTKIVTASLTGGYIGTRVASEPKKFLRPAGYIETASELGIYGAVFGAKSLIEKGPLRYEKVEFKVREKAPSQVRYEKILKGAGVDVIPSSRTPKKITVRTLGFEIQGTGKGKPLVTLVTETYRKGKTASKTNIDLFKVDLYGKKGISLSTAGKIDGLGLSKSPFRKLKAKQILKKESPEQYDYFFGKKPFSGKSRTSLLIFGGAKKGKLINLDLVRGAIQARTATGTSILKEGVFSLSPKQKERITIVQKEIAILKGDRGLKVNKPLFKIDEFKNQEKASDIIVKLTKKKGGHFFGSSTTQQLPKGYRMKIGDVDIKFKYRTEKGLRKKIVPKYVKQLRKSGENVFIGESGLEIVSSSGNKLVEFKAGRGKQTGEIIPEGALGFDMSGKTIPFGKARATTAGEQFKAKAVASTYFRGEAKNLPKEFSGGGVFPKAKRLKDLLGKIAQSQGLVAIRKGTYKNKFSSTKAAEELGMKYIKTFSPKQQSTIRTMIREGGAEKVKIDIDFSPKKMGAFGKSLGIKSTSVKSVINADVGRAKMERTLRKRESFVSQRSPIQKEFKTFTSIKSPSTKQKSPSVSSYISPRSYYSKGGYSNIAKTYSVPYSSFKSVVKSPSTKQKSPSVSSYISPRSYYFTSPKRSPINRYSFGSSYYGKGIYYGRSYGGSSYGRRSISPGRIVPPPPIKLTDDRRRRKKRVKERTFFRPFKYTSTIVPAEFNIRGTRPKILTGVSRRVLVSGGGF